jgi:hypothetical protein
MMQRKVEDQELGQNYREDEGEIHSQRLPDHFF